MPAPSWAGELFEQIAVPRLPGSPALEAVEDVVRRRLAGSGYQVERQSFQVSTSRLRAVAVAGAGLGWSTLATAPLLVLPLPGWSVALIGLAALALAVILAVGVWLGFLPFGVHSTQSANVVATRGEPAFWLVAHADSKGQRFSLRGRVIGTAAAAVGASGLALLLMIRITIPLPIWIVAPVALAALAGAAVLSASAPRGDSPGAVDNASGVVAALVAADRLQGRNDVGILITGAEEYGMEGARAWIRVRPAHSLFVNFDGIDSRGAYRVMEHRPRSGTSSEPSANRVATGLVGVLHERGHSALRRRLPVGVLVDGVVLAGAGLAGVTVSRGDWRTLAVVHTARDTAARVDVLAAVETGEAVAEVVTRLLG